MSFQNLAGRGGSEGGKISELHRGRVLSVPVYEMTPHTAATTLFFFFSPFSSLSFHSSPLFLSSILMEGRPCSRLASPLPATDHAVFPRLHYYITIGVTISRYNAATSLTFHDATAAAHSLHGYHAAGMTPEMPTFTRTTNNATVYTASSTPFDDGIISGERTMSSGRQGSECEIIHQDIKTTDISLDEKRVAKFADFGVVLFEYYARDWL
ncbi:hypothetical protein CK203_087859 [Vitis vinifera]|uniref:Protein kinase domain-containing protein n=1 Tax=Vitis vinifera TaxID=29760 RepID=A0A438DQW9_VITVI|nr:hypothetical protein CK203_087859 [Vitis vinifera]